MEPKSRKRTTAAEISALGSLLLLRPGFSGAELGVDAAAGWVDSRYLSQTL